jgi:hypothetical protein
MASPLPSAKKSVNMASSPVRVSRIRRDPPPIAQKITVRDPDERDQRTVLFGVASFAAAIVIITIAFAGAYGWSPSQYNIEINNL